MTVTAIEAIHRPDSIDQIPSTRFHRPDSMSGFYRADSICRFHRACGFRRAQPIARSIVQVPSCRFLLPRFHPAHSIVRIPSGGLYRADSIVQIPSHLEDSIMQIPLCGFYHANSIPSSGFHHAGFIVRILLCGFYHAYFIVQVLSCGFYCADSIVRNPSCVIHCAHSIIVCISSYALHRIHSIMR